MDDVGQGTVRIQQGRVDGAPVALLEAAPFRLGPTHVVPLNDHNIRLMGLQHTVHRGAGVADGVSAGVIGVVGKHLEQVLADYFGAAGQGGLQVGFGDGDDAQVRSEDQVQPGKQFENLAEVGDRFVSHVVSWWPYHSSSLRSLSAFAITETELKVIAALAIIGLSSRPKTGYSTPAATGTPSVL